jgi:hypothetical protein
VACTKGTFGSIEQLSGGHYRARYIGPDGRRYKAPTTFLTIKDARGWLAVQQADIIRKAWVPPEATPKVTRPPSRPTPIPGWRTGTSRTAPASITAGCWMNT